MDFKKTTKHLKRSTACWHWSGCRGASHAHRPASRKPARQFAPGRLTVTFKRPPELAGGTSSSKSLQNRACPYLGLVLGKATTKTREQQPPGSEHARIQRTLHAFLLLASLQPGEARTRSWPGPGRVATERPRVTSASGHRGLEPGRLAQACGFWGQTPEKLWAGQGGTACPRGRGANSEAGCEPVGPQLGRPGPASSHVG